MATEKFDGYARVDMIMKKADSTQEDIKKAYSVWSKTYDEVTINSGSNEDHRECMRVGSHASLVLPGLCSNLARGCVTCVLFAHRTHEDGRIWAQLARDNRTNSRAIRWKRANIYCLCSTFQPRSFMTTEGNCWQKCAPLTCKATFKNLDFSIFVAKYEYVLDPYVYLSFYNNLNFASVW
jgi:hypothetical protein